MDHFAITMGIPAVRRDSWKISHMSLIDKRSFTDSPLWQSYETHIWWNYIKINVTESKSFCQATKLYGNLPKQTFVSLKNTYLINPCDCITVSYNFCQKIVILVGNLMHLSWKVIMLVGDINAMCINFVLR